MGGGGRGCGCGGYATWSLQQHTKSDNYAGGGTAKWVCHSILSGPLPDSLGPLRTCPTIVQGIQCIRLDLHRKTTPMLRSLMI